VLACLVVVDQLLLLWHPPQVRLAEQFTGDRFERLIDDGAGDRDVLAVLGDSVLWGYKVAPGQSAPVRLAAATGLRVVNVSYEGGSAANTYFGLRLMLQRQLRPREVLFNINSKEFSPADSAYNRLHPSLRQDVEPLLTDVDRRDLAAQPEPDLNGRLERIAAASWRLYRWRADLREALFGQADASTALASFVQTLTGESGRAAAGHAPTADHFFATYDLTPIGNDNVAYRYLERTASLLRSEHLHAVVFLTPTNHALLHEYIDAPEYDANLRRLSAAFAGIPGVTVLNLDRAIPAAQFIDNDHLTPAGNEHLARILAGPLREGAR
jgi:hypothetical protein